MALAVEADGVKLVVDPGVSFAPRRYGLPPHPVELARVEEIRRDILHELSDADYVVITHYHYDHYLYRSEWVEAFRGKVLLVKHPESNINVSQKLRAHRFLNRDRVKDIARRVEYADGRVFNLDSLKLVVSKPVPHGVEGTPLGFVVMVLLEYDGCRLVHASDVQGPANQEALSILLGWSPSVVFISGPPIYREPVDDDNAVERGLRGLRELASSVPLVIADHHLARSLDYVKLLNEFRAKVRASILSAAEFLGRSIELLEARRRELWREEAPNSHRAS
jgi:predicted metallo-beta-lactamase superfamily hydrolase